MLFFTIFFDIAFCSKALPDKVLQNFNNKIIQSTYTTVYTEMTVITS
jgi:hypothetical protein